MYVIYEIIKTNTSLSHHPVLTCSCVEEVKIIMYVNTNVGNGD